MVNVNAQALAFIYTQTGNAPAKPATLPRPPRPLTTSRYHTSRRPFRPSVPRYSRECWCDCCTGSNCRPSRQRIIYFTLAPYCTQNACSQSCSFFVVRLRNPMSNPATLTNTDPLIQCDLMESRDAFLNFAREKHCEFSSLRRAKYSTMVSLIELHSSTADKISYTCNSCRQLCDIRYHCTICEDY
ncbi:unnamed protein product [Rotaria sp. Silwood1]|nr:unnamed protein product [Rotaria sp. Silwood1]